MEITSYYITDRAFYTEQQVDGFEISETWQNGFEIMRSIIS